MTETTNMIDRTRRTDEMERIDKIENRTYRKYRNDGMEIKDKKRTVRKDRIITVWTRRIESAEK